MEWTKAQKKTIELRNKNILVSAAAGSGKTAVLVERIKQLVIKDFVDIDRFLIATFTNAASLEMKERLEKSIRDEIKNSGNDLKKQKFLRRQLELLPKASIGTFHNFALEIMKQYFYLTDLEPGFKIGDDVQISIMKRESADELFENRFENDFEKFKEFLKKYSSDRSENRIKNNIISIYDELRSIPDYLKWAEERTDMLGVQFPLVSLNIADCILKDTEDSLYEAEMLYSEAADLIFEEGIESLAEKARQDAENVEFLRIQIEHILDEKFKTGLMDTDAAENILKSLKSIKLNTMRASKAEQESYNSIKEKVSNLRKRGKKLIDDTAKVYFSCSFDEYGRELNEIYPDTKYFLELIAELETIFKEKKREKNMVDFDDIMHYAIDILKNDMASAEYRDRFEYLFIDEFQDSNMLQEMIIEKIARDNNLFMVGDVKQSIYKFRLAEPEIFKKKYELYSSSLESKSEKIDLNNNFRSKFKVTETVNRVFENIMEDYDENSKLHCTVNSDDKGYESRLTIIDKSDDEVKVKETSHIEAQAAADIIKESLGLPIYDVKMGVMRPLEYKDMVILSRSRNSISEIENYLNNEGIPAFGEAQGGYFETVEIQVFVNLLKVIDNKRRDIPLISVMRSVIFDFDIKELSQIRIESKSGSFYNAVESYIENGENTQIKNKIKNMMDKLSYWKVLSKTVTLEELLRVLLYDTGYYDYCSGLPVGNQRISNLRMLLEKGAAFETANYSGLYGFLSYIDAMKTSNISVGEAKISGEDENVVRIMTVHKSKGLEFPMVILVGAGRMIKAKGSNGSINLHKDFAIGLPYVNRKEHWHRKTLLQRVIERKKAKEELDEEVRILYVAFTRAMDKLEIIGSINDIEKLDERNISKKSYLEMVYPSFKLSGDNVRVEFAGKNSYYENKTSFGIRNMNLLTSCINENRSEELYEKIDRLLSFKYPYGTDDISVKSKYSVTELSGRNDSNEKRLDMINPDFSIDKSRLSAADLGSAIHLVMEKTDFSAALKRGRPYIEERIDFLKNNGALTLREADSINIDNILGFFDSNIGIRAAKAQNIEKEREFILLKEVEGKETIVQGIIDCYFEDEEGLTLIDYKNIYVGKDVPEESIIEKYQNQLDFYKEAIFSSLGKKVDEAYIYLFNLKKFIKGR